MGNLNSKIKKKQEGERVGKFRLGTRNRYGKKWVQWCITDNQDLVSKTLMEMEKFETCLHEWMAKQG